MDVPVVPSATSGTKVLVHTLDLRVPMVPVMGCPDLSGTMAPVVGTPDLCCSMVPVIHALGLRGSMVTVVGAPECSLTVVLVVGTVVPDLHWSLQWTPIPAQHSTMLPNPFTLSSPTAHNVEF